MKAELAFSVVVMENRAEEMIVDAEREAFDEDRFEDLPSMVGYTVKAGEGLWDIAKRYYTAPEDVMCLTEHGGELREGDVLLIVKAVGE
jgi:nucleoid-associated protein YgaU